MKQAGYNSYFITQDDQAEWLVTYADLMTLLMVFFVLLYSLASFEKERYKTTVAAVKAEVKKTPDMKGLMPLLGRPDGFDKKIRIDEITGIRNRDTALYRSMDRVVKNAAVKDRLALEASSGKIMITMSGEALFASGSARLSPSGKPNIDRLIDVFMEFDEYSINIKGHTDNVPISTKAFPSNWELSAIRATNVLKYLISKGINPDRLTATGYGEILPLADNNTDTGRAKNRRVEFVLEKKKMTDPLLITDDTKDLRQAFRYVFKEEKRPATHFLGKSITIVNISAGGLAFINQGFKKYDVDQISLDLTMPHVIKEALFNAQLRILHITENNICHCIFENCNVDDYEIIHKFVLEMQKKDIQNSRS